MNNALLTTQMSDGKSYITCRELFEKRPGDANM